MSTTPHASPSQAKATSPAESLLAIGQKRLLGNYRQVPIVLDRGEGAIVFDTDGRRYIDLAAGVAVSSLGHAHPRLVKAMADQAARLIHASNYYFNAENIRFADELCQRLGYDRAFFCNSGAEANEAALKLARHHFWGIGQKDRTRIIAFDHSFHGRTMGAVALTGTPKYREGFGAPLAGITHVAYGDAEAVRATMGPDVAAIIVEPVQGEGGVNVPPPGFLAELRSLCDAHGALLIVDEVQTGFGRTGKWLGSDHDGVRGDVVTLAKGIAGGFPLGAMLVTESLAGALPPGTHGSTFGGNALGCAAARTVMNVIDEERLLDKARDLGEHLSAGLRALVAKHPKVARGERGRGLLRALVLAPGLEPRAVLNAIRERGVLVIAGGSDALRFAPPLVVTRDQIDEALAEVEAVLADLSSGR